MAKVTIDDLAMMVKRGFDDMQQRFDETATKAEFRQVDEQLTGLEHRMIGLAQQVDGDFQHVNARLDRIRDDIADLPAIREELTDLRERVQRLERAVGRVG